jgi:hypothetical protein
MSVDEQTATGLDLPRRRGKAAATLLLEQAILGIVEERAPITVRGVCYALFTRGLIPNMSTNSTGKVSRVMTDMRESGTLDWTEIVDGSRAVERPNVWDSPEQRIQVAIRGYRRDHWQDQPAVVEVWSEKSTVHGVLEPVLDELGCTFRVMKGFGSFTAVRQAAEDSLRHELRDRKGIALYIGDWDPSGLYMSEVDLPGRLRRYGSAWEFRRIALTRDDLDDLPHFDTDSKKGDVRLRWYLGNTTADPRKSWELDAMDPNTLRTRVHEAIWSHMDYDKWMHALRVEQAEIQSMEQFLTEWGRFNGRSAA